MNNITCDDMNQLNLVIQFSGLQVTNENAVVLTHLYSSDEFILRLGNNDWLVGTRVDVERLIEQLQKLLDMTLALRGWIR